MKPDSGESISLKDKGMCQQHGNFFPCKLCNEAVKDKKTENAEESEKEESGELKIETARLENILGSAKGLVSALRERDKEGFNPLIGENELSRLSAALHEGDELIDKKMATEEELNDVIMKITRAIEEIGNTPRERSIKDDPESLQKVVSRIRRLRDDTHEMGASIVKTDGRSDSIVSAIKQLEETLDKKQVLVGKKRDRLAEFFGR